MGQNNEKPRPSVAIRGKLQAKTCPSSRLSTWLAKYEIRKRLVALGPGNGCRRRTELIAAVYPEMGLQHLQDSMKLLTMLCSSLFLQPVDIAKAGAI